RVRVDVDEPGHDELAARIDCRGRLACDAGLDRCDPALHDPDIARGVEPQRRIDHAAALDHEIETRVDREHARAECHGRRCRRRGRTEFTSIEHRSSPPPRAEGDVARYSSASSTDARAARSRRMSASTYGCHVRAPEYYP